MISSRPSRPVKTSRQPLAAVVVLLLLILPAMIAASRNIAPDAVTRATTWNTFSGDLASLQDGVVPAADQDALPFLWEGGGILVFEWDEPVELEKVRSYIGEIGNNYVVRAYLGGRMDESGVIRDPMGVQTANLADDSRKVGQWTQVQFPAGTMADNIELLALGTILFYEIEILARDASPATTIEASRWGPIKYLPKYVSPQLRP